MPYLCTIDPQNLAEALGKHFFIEPWNDFFAIRICRACYFMLKDKGVHFHRFPRHYCQKEFHGVVQQGEKW